MRYLWTSVFILMAQTADSADVVRLARESCPGVGVLPEIALKVMRVESNCEPYAIGVQMKRLHRSYFNASAVVATATLQTALGYTSNVGIGVMQVNWWAQRDHLELTPADLLDPQVNIQVGCLILSQALGGSGSLIERIGRYHSQTPELRDGYGQRVIGAIPCGD